MTITLPGCARINSTARTSSPSKRDAALEIESASIIMAARAAASHSFALRPELIGIFYNRMIDNAYRLHKLFRFPFGPRIAQRWILAI